MVDGKDMVEKAQEI
jgi:hypothetical protein